MLKYQFPQAKECLSKFIWDFNVGDNIEYNFKILYILYHRKNTSQSHNQYYIKPIIVQIVSIIEGIFYDLVCRFDKATNHFPQHIPATKRQEIKDRIASEKVLFKRIDGLKFRRIKNYSFDNLIKLFQEFEILGKSDDLIYQQLVDSAYIRNRIHIFNYFNNHARKEENAFSEWRLEQIEKLLDSILEIMETLYRRPFD